MAKLLKDRGISFHCDGARLWEAQPFYGEPFGDLCSSFDSVYVSFYKASVGEPSLLQGNLLYRQHRSASGSE